MTEQPERKKKSALASFLFLAIQLGGFAAAGICTAMQLTAYFEGNTKGFWVACAACFILLFVLLYTAMLAHEAGHMIFGLLSGYEFVSFRVGRFLFVRRDGRLQVKRFHIPGTGGQCLMSPPADRADFPVALYNLGGCLVNFVLGAASFVLYGLFYASFASRIVFLLFGILNATLFLSNILPFSPGIATDGMNLLLLRNPAERQAFWMSLYANAYLTSGGNMAEFPEELLAIPENIDYSSYLQASAVPILRLTWFEVNGRYEEALALTDFLLENAALLDLHKFELRTERLLFWVLFGHEEEEILKEYDATKAYIRSVQNYFISKQAILCALSFRFAGKEPEGVLPLAKQEAEFERVAKRFPYESETENYRKILADIKAGVKKESGFQQES